MKPRILLSALSLVTLLAGTVRAGQEELAASMKEARLEAAQTRDQLAATLAALTALTKQDKGDLSPTYKAFTAELPKTEAAAAVTKTRAAWMDGDGRKYLEDWQKTTDSISNMSLRKLSQKRLDATRKSYLKVAACLKDAGEKFKPFLADLSDVQKVLANDLTATGIRHVRGTVNDANSHYKVVNRTIDDALEEMKRMEASLSSEAK
jgi:hypothetical protein